MTGRIVLGGRRAGRNLAAVRMMIEADQRDAVEAARTIVLTAPVGDLEVGQTIQLGGEKYRIAGAGPGASQVLIELAAHQQVSVERAPAPQFGGARPYLKKKKGRA